MKLSFRYKFILAFVTLEIVFLSVIAFLNFSFIDKSSQKLIDDKIKSIELLSQKLLIVPVSTYDLATVDDILSSLLQLDSIQAAQVSSVSGDILSKKTNIDEKLLDSKRDFNIALKSDDITVGYLHMWLDFSKNIEVIEKNKLQTLEIIALEIFISILLSLAIGRNIAINLESLTADVNLMKDDQHHKIKYIKSNDEVEVLSKAMQNMQESILEKNEKIIESNKKLEQLNLTLEKRVKEEVEKNRQKDHQLLQQSKLAQMGEMIGMIAHQWRQPLNAISSTTNNILFKVMLDEYDKEFFEKEARLISEYSQNLSKTIDDFRNFFKEDKEKTQIDLNDIVNNTLNIVESSLISSNITINTDLNVTKPVETFGNEIQQVVLNLIKNSEDAILQNNIKDGYINITTNEDDKALYLSIKDNGGGIFKDIADNIFDPYFSTKISKEGNGLGLYMSKTIIEDHCHGKLDFSTKENTTTFNITLYL